MLRRRNTCKFTVYGHNPCILQCSISGRFRFILTMRMQAKNVGVTLRGQADSSRLTAVVGKTSTPI